jgi:hypothetical protein
VYRKKPKKLKKIPIKESPELYSFPIASKKEKKERSKKPTLVKKTSDVSQTPSIPDDGVTKDKSKIKRKKTLKGTYEKYFDLMAIGVELEDTGSSISHTDSSEKHEGEEDENHPDMNWFTKDEKDTTGGDNEETDSKDSKIEKIYNNIKFKNVLDPYLWICRIFGRLPFNFSLDKQTGVWTCEMKRKSGSFIAFVVTTIFMSLVMLDISFAFLDLVNSDTEEKKTNPYL